MSPIGLLMAKEKQAILGREAHSVASQDSLACPRILGEDHSVAKISSSSPQVVAG